MSTEINEKPSNGKNKHNLTPVQKQQKELEKLFERIDKPIQIPTPPPTDKNPIPPPKDFVRNVSGKREREREKKGEYKIYNNKQVQVLVLVVVTFMCIEHKEEGSMHA